MPSSSSFLPLAKRLKLDDTPPSDAPETTNVEHDFASKDTVNDDLEDDVVPEDGGENNCSICLETLLDRTVIPKCSHEFCFECLLVWTEQSRRCPLCLQAIEGYLIHSIRSRYDYRKYHLPPLRTSTPPPRSTQSEAMLHNTRHYARRRRREREWGTRNRDNDESDKLERSIMKRRWIYQHDLYAKHVASNSFTKYRPYPTPAQFSASHDLISRTTTFLRRELQVWEGLDIEFLTTLILSLMKAIDIRSESAVKLIAEFLDMDAPYTPGGRLLNAEHFAHEVYCYVRSPYKDLFVYDTVVQYEAPPSVSPPVEFERGRRWHAPSPPQPPPAPLQHAQEEENQHVHRPSRSAERSLSWSPSGRRYSPNRHTREISHRNTSESLSTKNGESSKSRSKRYQQPSIEEKDVIIWADKKKSSGGDSKLASSSKKRATTPSFPQVAEDISPFWGTRDVKGKRKAYEMDEAYVLAEPADNREGLDRDSAPVAQEYSANDVIREVLEQNVSTSHPSSKVMKAPRNKAPRNKSLYDSVRAHLQGNKKYDAILASQPAKKPPLLHAQALIVSAGGQKEAVGDNPKNTTATVDMPLSNDAIGNLSLTDIVDKNGDLRWCSPTTDANNDDARGLPPTRSSSQTSDFQETSRSHPHEINSPWQSMGKFTSAANKSIMVAVSPVHIHLYSSPSSLLQDCTAPADSDGVYKPLHHRLSGPSGTVLSEQIQLPTSDVTTSDQFGDDRSEETPYANPLNSLDARAEARMRLLVRLNFEKTQAEVLSHSNMSSNVRDGAETRGMERNMAGDSFVSPKPDHRAQSDPDSVSESVAEEARVKEARLRIRARLRARLAVEKRLAEAS